MALFTDLFYSAWRNWVTINQPSTGEHDPDKTEIRAIGPAFDTVFGLIDQRFVGLTSGVQSRQSVSVALFTNVDLATGCENGDVQNGVTFTTGMRFAPLAQSAGATITDLTGPYPGRTDSPANGVYIVQATGAAVRAPDMDAASELPGATFFVSGGTVGKGATFRCSTPAPITVGTTGLMFVLAGEQASTAVPATLDALRGVGATIVASGPTINIAAATGDYFNVTPSGGTLTGLGTGAAGIERVFRVTAPVTLVHSAALILPGAVDQPLTVDDVVTVRSLGGGNWIATALVTVSDAFLLARANHTGTQSADTITDGTTNKAYTAAEKTKLAGVAPGATANSPDATLLARANHTGTQSADTLTDGTTNKAFLATERTKLAAIAPGATANSPDATLLDRANHTGTQPMSTVDGLEDALGDKANLKAVVQTQGRPGDVIERFSASLTGDASVAGAPNGTIVTGPHGSALRVTGASVNGRRERTRVEGGRLYQVRFAAYRSTDPADPAGDTVRFGIQWLTSAKAANGQLTDPTLDLEISVAGGRVATDIVVGAVLGESVDFAWPAGTVYMVPFVQTFGSDGVTNIEIIDWLDVSAAGIISGDVGEIAADLAAEIGRATAAEAAIAADVADLETNKEDKANKGAANGYAPLGADQKVPEENQSGITAHIAGAGGLNKTIKTNASNNLDPSFLDPMPTWDQIWKAASSIPAAATTNLNTVSGAYAVITTGDPEISLFSLANGALRLVRFQTTGLVIKNNANISTNNNGQDVVVASGDHAWVASTITDDVVYFIHMPKKRGVVTSAGAVDSMAAILLDPEGKQDFSTQPKQYIKRTGGRLTPLWAWGGKGLALLALYQDGTLRGPMLDAMTRAVRTIKTRTKPGGTLFSVGGKGLALFGVKTNGELVNKTVSRIAAQAKRAETVIDVWPDGDSRSDLGINPGRTRAQGWPWWTQLATGGRVRFQDRNFGLGGDNSQQILDSAGALWGAPPGWVVCFMSINDPPEGNGAAWTLERIIAYRDRVLKMGHKVVFVAETPKGDPNAAGTYFAGFTGSQLRHHLSDRAVLLQQAAIAGCFVIDPWLDFIDPLSPNAKAKAGLLREGLHFGPPGARLIGLRLGAFFNQMVPPRSFLPTTVTDLFHPEYVQGSLSLNPLFQTTGGTGIVGANCIGTVADGWEAVAASGLTGDCSVIAASSGFGNHQQIIVGGTGPTSVETSDSAGNLDVRPISVVLQQTIMDTTLGVPLNPGYVNEGDSFQAMCFLEANAGIADVRGAGLYAWFTTSAGTFISAAGEPDVTRPTGQVNLGLPNVAFSGPMITPETKPIVGTPTKAGVFWALTGVKYAGGVAIPASGTFRISQCKTQKVLNQNPL